ncbi:MAG: O-antigen ligase C-terminal domain-containing protein [Curvibacter sp.]|nr:O-antigen ligase C-terminal domain-containing protein [Curvibacter sp.]
MILPRATIAARTPRKGRFSGTAVVAALGFLVFIAAWLIPNHYPPWTSFYNEGAAFLALAMLGLAGLAQRDDSQFDAIPLILAFFVLIVGLQWAGGLIAYHGDAVLSSLYLVGFAIAWCLGRQAVGGAAPQSPPALDWLATAVVVASAISVYAALLQWLSMESETGNMVTEWGAGGRPGANLAQANHFATLTIVAAVLSIHLHERGFLRRWQLYALLSWMALGTTTAESRTALLSVLALGVLFVWRGRELLSRVSQRALFMWWAALIALFLTWAPLNRALLLTPTRGVAGVANDAGRLQIWHQMLAAIEQSPWWGYGWRQTVLAQKAGSAAEPAAPITDYAHNLALDLYVWLGVPLASVLLVCVAWWLLRAVNRIQTVQQWLIVAAVVPVLVHSLVEFPFAYAYFLFPCAALLGMLAALQYQPTDRTWSIAPGWSSSLKAVVFGLFMCVSGWAAYEYRLAEDDFRVMRFEMRAVGQRPEGHEPPNLLLLDQIGEVLYLGRLEPTPHMPKEDIERLRVASDNTMWATAHLRYIVSLGLNGRPDDAKRELRKLKDFYGERSYAQAKSLILELQKSKYPQLKDVVPP